MKKLLLILLILVFIWLLWIRSDRDYDTLTTDLALDHKEVIAYQNDCERNVVAIQPYMFTSDYLTEKSFYDKMHGYFEAAKVAGYFNENTVVLLPEYLGTWLVIRGEKLSVATSDHMDAAMFTMIMSRPRKFLINAFKGDFQYDPLSSGIFRMKAVSMASTYATVFKSLAQQYQVSISAGSIILPGAYVEDNQIKVDLNQALFNSSFIFKSDGVIDTQIIKKSYPINSEQSFISSTPIEELPLFDLPIGKTAILVCADSWYPESYERIKELDAEIILVNSYCAGDGMMNNYWAGYDGNIEPDDVDLDDLYEITEQDAWIKYALSGRIHQSGASYGVNVFLRGELWNLGTDGQPFFVADGNLLERESATRAGIWNFCF
jgi:hypothetical protein